MSYSSASETVMGTIMSLFKNADDEINTKNNIIQKKDEEIKYLNKEIERLNQTLLNDQQRWNNVTVMFDELGKTTDVEIKDYTTAINIVSVYKDIPLSNYIIHNLRYNKDIIDQGNFIVLYSENRSNIRKSLQYYLINKLNIDIIHELNNGD